MTEIVGLTGRALVDALERIEPDSAEAHSLDVNEVAGAIDPKDLGKDDVRRLLTALGRLAESAPAFDLRKVDPVRFALSRGGREVFRLAPGDVVRGTLTAQLLDHLHRDPAHRLGATRPRRAANAAVGCATDVLIAPLAGKDRTLGLLVARPADPADATGPAPVELSDVAATLIRVAERVGGAWQGAQDAGAAPVRQPWWRGGHPNRGAAYRAEGLQHRWDLPFDPGSVSVARTVVGEACRNWGASAPVRTVELVTSELVANAVRHGWGGVRVTVSVTETGILVEVLDGSPEPPVCRRGGEVPMGGYGIRIVEQLATWGWRRERVGKTVWALVPRA